MMEVFCPVAGWRAEIQELENKRKSVYHSLKDMLSYCYHGFLVPISYLLLTQISKMTCKVLQTDSCRKTWHLIFSIQSCYLHRMHVKTCFLKHHRNEIQHSFWLHCSKSFLANTWSPKRFPFQTPFPSYLAFWIHLAPCPHKVLSN